jgi:HK97 family phage prohead protease
MERKALSVAAEFKVNASQRIVEGYASVFNNIDGNDDIVMPGCYTKTLRENLSGIKVKRNHKALIGRPIHAEQDSTGLFTRSHVSQTALGDETLALIADGVIDRMSIGFYPVKKDYSTKNGQSVRLLHEAKLKEWSFMDDDAANDRAVVTSLKSLTDLDRAYQDYREGRLPPLEMAALFERAAEEAKALAAPAVPAHEPSPASESDPVADLRALQSLLATINRELRRD